VSYDALWEHPDKHLVELTPQERKEFAWQLAELGKRHTKTPAAAKPILMLCYMALRGELAAQEGDIEFIIQDLKCCLSPKDPGVESAACAAMKMFAATASACRSCRTSSKPIGVSCGWTARRNWAAPASRYHLATVNPDPHPEVFSVALARTGRRR